MKKHKNITFECPVGDTGLRWVTMNLTTKLTDDFSCKLREEIKFNVPGSTEHYIFQRYIRENVSKE